MNSFAIYFKNEARRVWKPGNIIIAIVFIIVSLYFIQNGIDRYNSIQESTSNFKELERIKTEKTLNYEYYGAFGIQIKTLTSPLGIFFVDSGLFSEWYANVDIGAKINLYNTIKGRNAFIEKSRSYTDFGGFLAFIGSLLMLFYGYQAFRDREYLRHIASISGRMRSYIYLILSRGIISILFFAIVLSLGILLTLIEGVKLSGTDYIRMLGFFGTWTGAALCFFLTGTFIGSFKSHYTGITLLIAVWYFFNSASPIIVEKMTIEASKNIAINSKADLEKLNILVGAENRIAKILGAIKKELLTSPEYQKQSETLMNNELKKIQDVEKRIEQQMRETAAFNQNASVWTFSTFLNLVSSELSGKGYSTMNDFFKYSQDLKARFCEFYKQKRYYSKDKKVESFIKNDENIYKAESRFPSNMEFGVFVLVLYIIVLLYCSYIRYRHVLCEPYREDKEPRKASKEIYSKKILLDPGDFRVMKKGFPRFLDYLYGVLMGYKSKGARAYFKGDNRVFIKEIDIIENTELMDTLYICHSDDIPCEIRACDYFRMAAYSCRLSSEKTETLYKQFEIEKMKSKCFNELEKLERLELMLSVCYMKEWGVVILDDIVRSMSIRGPERVNGLISELTGKGTIVLLLVGEIGISDYELQKDAEYSDITVGWKTQMGRQEKEV